MRLRSTFGTAVRRARATGLRAFGAMAGFASFAARATVRLAMSLFSPNLRTSRFRTGFTKAGPRTTPLRTAGLWAFRAATLTETGSRALALHAALRSSGSTPLRTAGLRDFWAVTMIEAWSRALRTVVRRPGTTALRPAGLWALLIFLVTLGCFSTTVVIMVAVTMMAPFVAIVVATPMMALSITIMIPAAVLVAIVIMVTVTMMAPFVAIVVATPMMALSITIMFPTTVLVAIVIQYILLAGEGGFATFFAGAAFALAFAARAWTGPAFSFNAWTLPRTSLMASSHFLQFLGLFLSEDGSHFLLVFFAESAESLTNPLAVFAFPGFSHQFAKGGTLIFLQFFHLQSLFFVEPESLGHGGTAIGAFTAFSPEFRAPFAGAPFFFICLHGGGQKTGCEEKNSDFVQFHVCFGDYVLNFGERKGAKTLSVAARDAFGFWLVTMIMSKIGE